jgi:hypothetical protein
MAPTATECGGRALRDIGLVAAPAALRGGPRFTLTVLHIFELRSDGPGVHVKTGWRFSDGRIAATATQNE